MNVDFRYTKANMNLPNYYDSYQGLNGATRSLTYTAVASARREVAAVVMSAPEWDAGIALMKGGNPDGWAQLAADANLVDANRDKITGCRTAAAKSKKEERCTITLQASAGQ